MPLENHEFERREVFPSYFANRIQSFLSGFVSPFRLVISSPTSIGVAAGPGEGFPGVVCLTVQGRWRWIEEALIRSHPGGSAGIFYVFATATDNAISSSPEPYTDNTDYSWDLAIVRAGEEPDIVPGTVEIFRLIGQLEWNGAGITSIATYVGPYADVTPHAERHAASGSDPLPASSIATDMLQAQAVTLPKVTPALVPVADGGGAAQSALAFRRLGGGSNEATAGNDGRLMWPETVVKVPGVEKLPRFIVDGSMTISGGTTHFLVNRPDGAVWVERADDPSRLIRKVRASASVVAVPLVLPAPGRVACYSIEVEDTDGRWNGEPVFSAAKGPDTTSFLNAYANPAASTGKLRLWNIAGQMSPDGLTFSASASPVDLRPFPLATPWQTAFTHYGLFADNFLATASIAFHLGPTGWTQNFFSGFFPVVLDAKVKDGTTDRASQWRVNFDVWLAGGVIPANGWTVGIANMDNVDVAGNVPALGSIYNRFVTVTPGGGTAGLTVHFDPTVHWQLTPYFFSGSGVPNALMPMSIRAYVQYRLI